MERNNERTTDRRKSQVRRNEKKGMSGGQKVATGILMGVILGILCMWVLYSGLGQSMMVEKAQYDRLAKAESIIGYIQDNYYIPPDETSIDNGMYKGIVEGLEDPYSAYMTKDEYERYMKDAEGEYCGVGLVITENDKKQIEVVSVFDDSPAQEAGIKTGDILKKVDGKPCNDFTRVSDFLKGKKGTEVVVEYSRDGKVKDVTLKRDEIKTESVAYKMLKDKVGYIRISQFIKNTGADFCDAVEKLEKKKAKGMIIDLRCNGGGRVDECLKVADELLEEGIIVCYVDNKGKKTYSKSDEKKTKLKYVVLVDEGTASASEIVTAAVQDNGGGKIVGQNTFGKGIIQKVEKLEDGSAIKLTVMQYLSPQGSAIHKKGIRPDYVVENSEDKDQQLEKAIDILTD